MRYRSLLNTLFASLLLLAGPPITAQALPGSGSASGSGSGSASPCNPGTPPQAPQTVAFYQNDFWLGPEVLPQTPPVSPLLVGYDRFGNLTEAQWIADYHPPGGLIYPKDDGFLFIGDQSTAHPQELLTGMRVDRFGSPTGKYLSPVGEPFARRAIPPVNLNTPSMSPQSNYHVYCVLRPFRVDAGPAAPWFGQPGLGQQYVLNPSYVLGPEHTGQETDKLNILWMINNGYLAEEIPE